MNDPKTLDLEQSQKESLQDVNREQLARKEEEIALLKTEVIVAGFSAIVPALYIK